MVDYRRVKTVLNTLVIALVAASLAPVVLASTQEVDAGSFGDSQGIDFDFGEQTGGDDAGGGGEDFNFDMSEFESFGTDDFDPAELNAEQEAAAALATGAIVGMILFGMLMYLLLVFVAYIQFDALQSLPEQFRMIPAFVPWLLLVPFVQIVILFVAFIKVPQSLSKYLQSIGNTEMGDCGEKNGLFGAIFYIIGCTFPIGLVLLVMSMMKISAARKLVKEILAA